MARQYQDASGQSHGFVRDKDGTITRFDAPEAVYMYPDSINPSGEITGEYADASGRIHGFVRAANVTITTFDAPGAATLNGTEPMSINPGGEITGTYQDANGVYHGFLREP